MEDGLDDSMDTCLKGLCGRSTTMSNPGLDLCFKVMKNPERLDELKKM